MMTTIHFVRHGLVHNPRRVLYARLPRFRLSTEGQQQAAAAGDYLAARPLQAVYSSPMLRARQTAQAIVRHHPGTPLRVSRLLNETHTPHEGRPLVELMPEWDLFSNLPPGYETEADVFARAQRFIRRIRREYPGGEVVAVTHGHITLWMHLWTRGLPFTLETQALIDPFPETASITTLTFDNGAALPSLSYHRPY